MSDQEGGPEPASAETVYFDVWSMGDGTWQRDDGMPGTDDALYCWVDDLTPRRGDNWIGLAAFRGVRSGPNKVRCVGWFQVDHNAEWNGTLTAAGDVTLRPDGSVESGSLRVMSASNAGPTRITVSRDNPKRYIASG